jgi:CheY-like chemotaxis protein
MSNPRFIPSATEKTHDLGGVPELLAHKKILIVDDEVAFAEVIREFLGTIGYEATCVADGVQAIKKIMAGDYDVILCDMVMPNLAGDMFYLAVERTRPHLCKRFIFMTGHQGNSSVDAFIRKVRGLMLWKPFELHMLVEAIKVIEKKTPPQT